MPLVSYGRPLNALVAVKGHPFDRSAFDTAFSACSDIALTLVDQPAAARLMSPEGMRGFDVLVLYDMPGIDFAPGGPRFLEPEPGLREGLRALLLSGKGLVALHHAIAGWPAWSEYADLLGGAFLYQPGQLRGARRLDSGYRHDVAYTAVNVAPRHPIMAGLPETFPLTDELYLYEVFEAEVIPLLRARYAFDRSSFYSAAHAVAGRPNRNDGWAHPDGSNLIGWARRALNSPMVYLQPGDGPSAYGNPHFQLLLRNAIHWAASQAALDWARDPGPAQLGA